jgi:hypothetical protein
MILFCDTRQQKGKHKLKEEYFESQGIEIIRTKLPYGDYSTPQNPNIAIDTKKDIQELIGDLTKDHERFKRELQLAKKCGAKLIILVEDEEVTRIDDLYLWYNWRLKNNPRATKGRTLAKILHTIQADNENYCCEFMFTKKSECGAKIVELLSKK